jgi:hypothetical protein
MALATTPTTLDILERHRLTVRANDPSQLWGNIVFFCKQFSQRQPLSIRPTQSAIVLSNRCPFLEPLDKGKQLIPMGSHGR